MATAAAAAAPVFSDAYSPLPHVALSLPLSLSLSRSNTAERAYSSSLGLKLKDAEAKAIGLDERLAMYVGRLKEADKDIFKLERQLEEQQKGLDNGMAIAKKQIRRFEEKLVQAETERCRLEEKLEELQKKAE